MLDFANILGRLPRTLPILLALTVSPPANAAADEIVAVPATDHIALQTRVLRPAGRRGA